MKKISKLFAIMAVLASLAFISCSDVDTSGNVAQGVDTSATQSKDYTVQFFAEDGTALNLANYINANVAENTADRSIVPTAIDLSSGVYFYLWGTDVINNSNSITTPKKVDFELKSGETSKGTVTIDLASSKWNLVLVAAKTDSLTKKEDVMAAAYYIGYANQDLRYADSINFYLSSTGLTENGTATLKLVYDGLAQGEEGAATPYGTWTVEHKTAVTVDTANGYTIKASIRTRTDNSLATGVSEQTVTNADFFGTGKQLTAWSTKPGTYNLVVTFLNKKTSKSYEWSDIIVILPNQAITETVKVPDVIMYAPDKPSAFKVGYEEPKTADSNSYNAIFEWSDDSKNEKYFQVELFQIPSSVNLTAAVDDDTKWNTATTGLNKSLYQQIFDTDFYGNSQGWVAGSLLKNNEHIALTLALGARYICRIAAVNDAGASDWVYATYDNKTSWTDSDPEHTGTYNPAAYNIKEISTSTKKYADPESPTAAITASLFRITYYLNGGTYHFSSSDTATGSLVYYLSQDVTNGIPIYSPASTGETSTTTTTYESVTVADAKADSSITYYKSNTGTPEAYTNEEIAALLDDSSASIYKAVTTTTVTGGTYPKLINAAGNKWTSWRDGILEGDKYETSTSTTENNFTYWKPSNYKGCENLYLFASYTIAGAGVEVYVDKEYDFIDGEVAITGTGSTKKTTHYYTVDTHAAETLVANYAYSNVGESPTRTKNIAYDTISASIVRASDGVVVASGTFDNSNNYDFSIGQFAEGKYTLKVVAEYKGHQYSYNIVLDVFDGS